MGRTAEQNGSLSLSSMQTMGLIISVSPMGVYVSGPSRKFQIHGQALNFHLRFSELQQLPLLGPLIQMDLSSSALRLAVGTEGPT